MIQIPIPGNRIFRIFRKGLRRSSASAMYRHSLEGGFIVDIRTVCMPVDE